MRTNLLNSVVILITLMLTQSLTACKKSDPAAAVSAAASTPTPEPESDEDAGAVVYTSEDFTGDGGAALASSTNAGLGGSAMPWGAIMGEPITLVSNHAVAPTAVDGDHGAMAIMDTGSAQCTIKAKFVDPIGSTLFFRCGMGGGDSCYIILADPGTASPCLNGNPGYVVLDFAKVQPDICINQTPAANDVVKVVSGAAGAVTVKINNIEVASFTDPLSGHMFGMMFMQPTAAMDDFVIQDCH